MRKVSSAWKTLTTCFLFFYVSGACSEEYSIEANISAAAEYNDNIFLTNLPHDSVKGVTITPAIAAVIKERNWRGQVRARLKNYNYSDDNLDGTDQLFDLAARYSQERNSYSLNVNHNLDSNLNSTSNDFGTIVGRRIDRKSQSVTPQYSRLLTERAALQLSYTYNDVDFLEADNTGFVPYVTHSGSVYLVYELTERDSLKFSISAVDYASRDDLVTYDLLQTQIGIDHKFSEVLNFDFQIGTSRQSTTNLQTQTFDFFGQPILITQEIDSKTRGLVLDAGIQQVLESGQISGRISRTDRTNSFGGLDEVSGVKAVYTDKVTELWRVNFTVSYEEYRSISSGTRVTDRDIFLFDAKAFYSINRDWQVDMSYRYAARKFKNDTSDEGAPHSNSIYLGLTYNFPSLSTF